VTDCVKLMEKSDILFFATMRNEALRLPHFFSHHCELGS